MTNCPKRSFSSIAEHTLNKILSCTSSKLTLGFYGNCHGGAIIKTIGDAVMAAFLNPLDAMRAAIAMRDEFAVFNRDRTDRELVLKIGLHKGAAIALTLNLIS